MSEGASAEKKVYTLLQLNKSIKNTLETRAGSAGFWVRAEIANINEKNGHFYIELVEERDGRKEASMRGTIWARDARRIISELGDSADSILNAGAEIVFRAKVVFHVVYGLSLSITEIDLSVMLGELEKRKKATIDTITKEGRLEMNKKKTLPRVVHRVAVIGSPGTSGFRDFMFHVLKNEYRYRFDIQVIPAKVQGADAAADIRSGLEKIQILDDFDTVVLVRGGGSPLDLDCFNDLELARKISEMNIPVLTGIGHETDICVADLVSYQYFKTPTDVGDFLVDRTMRFESLLIEIATKVGSRSKQFIHTEKIKLDGARVLLGQLPMRMVSEKSLAFKKIKEDLGREIERMLTRQSENLQTLGNTMELLKPEKTLNRGYSILRKEGKAVASTKELSSGDVVELQLKDGFVKAQIK